MGLGVELEMENEMELDLAGWLNRQLSDRKANHEVHVPQYSPRILFVLAEDTIYEEAMFRPFPGPRLRHCALHSARHAHGNI